MPSRTAADRMPRAAMYSTAAAPSGSGTSERAQHGAGDRRVVAGQRTRARSRSPPSPAPARSGRRWPGTRAPARCWRGARRRWSGTHGSARRAPAAARDRSCAAAASGSTPRPACHSASRTNRRKASTSRTSPHCHAASSPPECAKPPVGKAESDNWRRGDGSHGPAGIRCRLSVRMARSKHADAQNRNTAAPAAARCAGWAVRISPSAMTA